MAIKIWYIEQITAATGLNILWYNELDGATPPAETTSASGWTVAKTGTSNYSLLSQSVEIPAGFGATIQPAAVSPTVTQAFSTTATYTPPDILFHSASISTLREYNGVFGAGTWSFNYPVTAVTNGGAQDGNLGLRVYKGTRSGNTFTSVTELTSARIASSQQLNIATAATNTYCSASWAAPEIRLNNEFLIVTLAWQITGASNNANADVLLRYGSGSTMISPNFKRNRQYLTDGF